MSILSNQSCEQDEYFFFERELVALKLQKVELQTNDETHHFENQKNQERITYMKEYLKNKKKEMNDLNVQLDEIAPSFEVVSCILIIYFCYKSPNYEHLALSYVKELNDCLPLPSERHILNH